MHTQTNNKNMYLKTGLRFVGIEVGYFDASAQVQFRLQFVYHMYMYAYMCVQTYTHICILCMHVYIQTIEFCTFE